ncbi:hypothetical protein ES703_07304 [subsurface metagenome]
MDKYIGFDIDSKKIVACVVQRVRPDLLAGLCCLFLAVPVAFPGI